MSMRQASDKLIYNGNVYDTHDYPMENYFFKNPEKRPQGFMLSCLWRGYIATFSFIADELVLEDISVLGVLGNKSVKELFTAEKDLILKIHWYNGLLKAAFEENILVIQLENGKIIKDIIMNSEEYDKFFDKWLETFRLSEKYKNTLGKIRRESERDFKGKMALWHNNEDALKYLPEPFVRMGKYLRR